MIGPTVSKMLLKSILGLDKSCCKASPATSESLTVRRACCEAVATLIVIPLIPGAAETGTAKHSDPRDVKSDLADCSSLLPIAKKGNRSTVRLQVFWSEAADWGPARDLLDVGLGDRGGFPRL
jgi:hypothetical protein